MSIGVENFPNKDTSNPTAYPNGIIKDDPGDGTGTPINVNTNADIVAFFDKLLRNAGITANGLPDNETNGYQYIDALYGSWTSTGITFSTVGGNTWTNLGSPNYNAAYKVMVNEVKLCGVVTITGGAAGTIPIITLPVGARPANTIRVSAHATVGGNTGHVLLYITTGGIVEVDTSSNAGGNVYLDGIVFRIG